MRSFEDVKSAFFLTKPQGGKHMENGDVVWISNEFSQVELHAAINEL
jgi:hypothetical protein